METKTKVYNTHYIDNVPIYNENKITPTKILENFNKNHENLKFTMTETKKESTSILGHKYIQLTRQHRNRHMPKINNHSCHQGEHKI
jgi:hypothetical protein